MAQWAWLAPAIKPHSNHTTGKAPKSLDDGSAGKALTRTGSATEVAYVKAGA
jgi:hypothetical protein